MGWQATGWAFNSPIENSGCKFVLVALAERAGNEDDSSRTWHCHPSIKTISEYTAQGYRTIQRHLDWLEANSFISRERRVQSKSRLGSYNFTLNPLGCQNGQWPKITSDVVEIGHTEPVIGTDQIVVIRAPDPFDVFWEAYPLKKAKDAARVAFARAIKRISEPDPLQIILRGVEYYKAEIARTGVLVKHPSTWLNGGCWNDEPTPDGGQADGRKQPASSPRQRTDDAMHAGFMEAAYRHRDRWRL